ncbi:hypothetical protein D3C78_1892640 [compost metagenome]
MVKILEDSERHLSQGDRFAVAKVQDTGYPVLSKLSNCPNVIVDMMVFAQLVTR